MNRVLVIAALQEELDAILHLKPQGDKEWLRKVLTSGLISYATEFQDNNGDTFEVVASTPATKGIVATAIHATKILSFYPHPDLSFMTGICAGRRNKGIDLGDVVVGNMAFHYEVGKKTGGKFEPEMANIKPDPLFVQWLNDFDSKKYPLEQYIRTTRPPTLRFQKEWVLFQIDKKEREGARWPVTDEDIKEARDRCPSWKQAINSLSISGFIEKADSLTLTTEGHELVARLKIESLTTEAKPDPVSPKVWIGAFATGSQVVADPNFFDELARRDRTVLALDMEAASFLEAVRADGANLSCAVIKGVCDFADEEKDDAFHHYAAEAAARWMLAFSQYALPLKLPDSNTERTQVIVPEGGGSSTQSDILYQNSVGALYLGRLCDVIPRGENERVINVRFEAPTEVDDIVVTFADGSSNYIQAKENVHDNESVWTKLWNDFETQFNNPDFKRSEDRLLLHTGDVHNESYVLRELCEHAAHSRDVDDWFTRLTDTQKELLDKIKPLLSPPFSTNPDSLLNFFSHIDVEIASLTHIERDLVPRWMPFSNEPPNNLFRLFRDRVGGAARYGGEFTAEDLRTRLLAEDKINLNIQPNSDEILAQVKECGAVLRQHKYTFGNTLKHLKRAVVDEIAQWARGITAEDNLALLLDQAGMGKTVVTRDVLLELEASGVAVLAIKADQQLSGINEPEDLRIRLHLSDSVERIVERLAERAQAVVIIDQIDALSLSMARDQKALNLVLDLVARLRLIQNVCIILSCRIFDLNNDPRLKQLEIKQRFTIPDLSEEEVKDILQPVGIDFDRLSPATQQLLKIPLHLDLFALAMESQVVGGGSLSEVQGIVSLQDLYTLLWRNVVRKTAHGAPPIAQRERVISLLTDYMHAEQRISAPQSILANSDEPDLEEAASWLASEGILIPTRTEWSFLHQTFFDYCYAKDFVEGGHSLLEAILNGDQGLFARPQIIQVLTFLRSVDPRKYLRELNGLLTAEGLRTHLYDLLIRWFGALPSPTEDEWLITRNLLLDADLRPKLLGAMGGNPGWFRYLKSATLQTWLGQEKIIDSLAIPYLISMLGRAQSEVINIVRPYLGRNEQWNRRLKWMIETIREWKTPEAIELFEQVFRSLPSTEIKHFYQLDDVAKADPQAGCRLLRRAFDKVFEEYVSTREQDQKAYLFSLSTHLEQFNGSTIDNALKEAVQKSPEYFLEQMLPWLEKVMELTAVPEDPSPYCYRSDEFSYLGWYGDSFVVKHELIEAYISALTTLASNDPEKFRQFVERLSASPHATPQRLLAHAFRALPEAYSVDAFRFLMGDIRRLDLGDHDQYDTRQLLKAIYPRLTQAQRAELDDFILSYDYIRKYAGVAGLRWRGIEQLYLLQAVPRELLTERGELGLRELERKFPNVRASESPTTMRMGIVGSPIPETRARKMSDRAWLRAMTKYQGDVRHKHDFLKGGARELGGVLVRLTKENPDRFYKLALRVSDNVDDSYVQAILNGLAESTAPADMLITIIRRFAPHPGRDIKGVIARVLEKRVKDGLPDDMIKLLEAYVRGGSGEDENWWQRQEENNQARYNDGLNSGPYTSYLNSDRGASFRALMSALDEKGSDEAKGLKWELIEFVSNDPSTALRAGAIEALLYMLHENRERAVSMFEQLIEGHPALLRSHFTQEFLRYGLYRYYKRMKPFIVTLMNESYEPLQQRGAELACIAAISPAALDSEDERSDANGLAEETLTGIIPWRRGAARVYATNITTEASDSCVKGLLRLLNDEDEEVRRFVNGIFHRLPDEQFISLRHFIQAYAASRSLSGEIHPFTEFLWEHGLLDPVFSLSVVETILGRGNESVARELSYRFSGGGEDLIRLVLGIYTYPVAGKELRKRAMDVFDQLMNVFTGQALMVLDEWDRR
jgi:nucleoside phosphorylase